VIVQPPVYPPFFGVIRQARRQVLDNPLVDDGDRYVMDLDGLRSAITPATRALMFCNPHNPTGRVFTRAELEALAEVVLEHRLWVLSDELHADLVFDGAHVPFASISPEIAQRTITVYGPTKAFNLAGAKIGFLSRRTPPCWRGSKEIAGYFLPGRQHARPGGDAGGLPGRRPWLEAALPTCGPTATTCWRGWRPRPRPSAATRRRAPTWCGSTSARPASATPRPPRCWNAAGWR
jgi:cysteine-S-conjugate beta-lyase